MRLVSPRSNDYKIYGYHVIENGPAVFQFTAGNRDSVPSTVEYHDGENLKQVDPNELLRSTSTHAFIVVRDNEVLYEDYFNGFARDSLCTTWSVLDWRKHRAASASELLETYYKARSLAMLRRRSLAIIG